MFVCSIFSVCAFASTESNVRIAHNMVELSSEHFIKSKGNGYYYILPKVSTYSAVDGNLVIAGRKAELKIGGFKGNFSYQFTQVDYQRYIDRFKKLLELLKEEDKKPLLKLLEDFAPSIDLTKTINISPVLVNEPYITAILISGINVRDIHSFSHEMYFLTEKELISLSYFTDKKYTELVKQ